MRFGVNIGDDRWEIAFAAKNRCPTPDRAESFVGSAGRGTKTLPCCFQTPKTAPRGRNRVELLQTMRPGFLSWEPRFHRMLALLGAGVCCFAGQSMAHGEKREYHVGVWGVGPWTLKHS